MSHYSESTACGARVRVITMELSFKDEIKADEPGEPEPSCRSVWMLPALGNVAHITQLGNRSSIFVARVLRLSSYLYTVFLGVKCAFFLKNFTLIRNSMIRMITLWALAWDRGSRYLHKSWLYPFNWLTRLWATAHSYYRWSLKKKPVLEYWTGGYS